jgi:hypothetical protein
MLDGIPCYSEELAFDAKSPTWIAYMRLRPLFGLKDDDLFQLAGFAF